MFASETTGYAAAPAEFPHQLHGVLQLAHGDGAADRGGRITVPLHAFQIDQINDVLHLIRPARLAVEILAPFAFRTRGIERFDVRVLIWPQEPGFTFDGQLVDPLLQHPAELDGDNSSSPAGKTSSSPVIHLASLLNVSLTP